MRNTALYPITKSEVIRELKRISEDFDDLAPGDMHCLIAMKLVKVVEDMTLADFKKYFVYEIRPD